MTDLLRPQSPLPWRERLDGFRNTIPIRTAVLIALVGAAATAAWALSGSDPAPRITLPQPSAAHAPGPIGGDNTTTTERVARVLVHVAGAVVHPGVEELPGDARVAEAVQAAGGAAPDADVDAVNLAARVADGDRVYMPRKGEVPPIAVGPGAGSGAGGSNRSGTGTATGPVDLNRATVDQLDALPGVGPATAAAIVDYRTRHGRFRSVEELKAVRGIGPAKLDALRSRVRV